MLLAMLSTVCPVQDINMSEHLNEMASILSIYMEEDSSSMHSFTLRLTVILMQILLTERVGSCLIITVVDCHVV